MADAAAAQPDEAGAAAAAGEPPAAPPASARPPISEALREEAASLFKLLAGTSGRLPTSDLRLAFEALQLTLPFDDHVAMMAEMEAHHTGSLDFEGFVRVLSRKFAEDPHADVKEAWARIDSHNTGHITVAELRHLLLSVEKMTDEEADLMIKCSFRPKRGGAGAPFFSRTTNPASPSQRRRGHGLGRPGHVQ